MHFYIYEHILWWMFRWPIIRDRKMNAFSLSFIEEVDCTVCVAGLHACLVTTRRVCRRWTQRSTEQRLTKQAPSWFWETKKPSVQVSQRKLWSCYFFNGTRGRWCCGPRMCSTFKATTPDCLCQIDLLARQLFYPSPPPTHPQTTPPVLPLIPRTPHKASIWLCCPKWMPRPETFSPVGCISC